MFILMIKMGGLMTKILLFSGGLDSFCLRKIIEPDINLYIDIGTEDGEREIKNIKEMPFDVKIIDFPLSSFELNNKIIPFRNNFFTLLAAQYGEKIFMGATKGDTTKDKDYIFKSQMENILNYFALDKHKVRVKEYPYKVKMPFKEMTKTDIIKKYLEKGGTAKELKLSRSCYKSGEKECGKCRSCLRKAVAYKLNDLDYNEIFESDPLKNISKENHEKMLSRKGEGDNYETLLSRI